MGDLHTMDADSNLIKAIGEQSRKIASAIKEHGTGTITFQRTHSITTIHKAHICSVQVTSTTVRVVTSNGAEAFYAVVDRDSNTDYLAAVDTLRNHGYSIPSFADLAPTAK